MAIDCEVKGIEEVTKLLMQLPDNMREKHTKNAIKEATSSIVSVIKARVPKNTGTLAASIQASRVKYYPASGTLFCAIEPKSGFTRTFPATVITSKRGGGRVSAEMKRNPRKYLHLVEGGRRAVTTVGKKALHPANAYWFSRSAASVSGRPIFGPVASAMAQAFRITIENELTKAVAAFNATNNSIS
jgi:hypothetical protein